MRNADGGYWRSPVVMLLAVLVILFLIECFLQVYGGTTMAKVFGLSLAAVQGLQVWRLVTYQFLHVAPWPWHVLFNGLGLWFFGRPILEALGPRRFWLIFLGAGAIGGVVELLRQGLEPTASVTVGASASVLGLAGTFCRLFPARETVFFLYFVPVRMRSMTMFWILFGFSVFGLVFLHDGVAHGAHLGGLLAGVAYVRFLHDDHPQGWWHRLRASRRTAARSEEIPVPAGTLLSRAPRPGGADEDGDAPEDFIRREVDPILDKISAHGIQSLTERERRILEKARERMRNR